MRTQQFIFVDFILFILMDQERMKKKSLMSKDNNQISPFKTGVVSKKNGCAVSYNHNNACRAFLTDYLR